MMFPHAHESLNPAARECCGLAGVLPAPLQETLPEWSLLLAPALGQRDLLMPIGPCVILSNSKPWVSIFCVNYF